MEEAVQIEHWSQTMGGNLRARFHNHGGSNTDRTLVSKILKTTGTKWDTLANFVCSQLLLIPCFMAISSFSSQSVKNYMLAAVYTMNVQRMPPGAVGIGCYFSTFSCG